LVIVMKHGATDEQIQHVVDRLHEFKLREHISKGEERTLIGAIGDERVLNTIPLEAMPGVEKVMAVLAPYKLASREFQPEDTVIKIDGVEIGGKKVVIMAGPCAVENEDQITTIAESVKDSGAIILRGGAFKPRTGPYSFQGLEIEGLELLAKAKEKTGLLIVTEVMSVDRIDLVAEYADILQIGARNMQNFMLLKAVGQIRKPVLLKRGMSATIEEFLLAAEYILSQGNHNVILCERGIRTFETYTRNTLDINAVPVLKQLSHLPVIVDPSHGTGRRELVVPVSKAAIAAGADGLIIEVHNNPEVSVSDGAQSLLPDQFAQLMTELKKIAEAVGRSI
jgi:3-deoxy-7-phosphoheptulonate synthase